ncbi:hypothetical protein [Maribacter sp. MMG018]|nr:hypothetical protein [Maribacter sp. MMG018]
MALTENWINLNLRYITDYKLRYDTKNILFQGIERSFLETN